MGLKWLITGGCGFIGTRLIRRLNSEGGHQVRILDNLSTGSQKDLDMVCPYRQITSESIFKAPVGIELVVGDIIDAQLAKTVTKGVDVIVHLAANTGVGPSVKDPRTDCVVNVLGTFNYLEAARINNISRFLFASSGAPAGVVEPPIHEEIPPHPISPYGASKLAGEGYCSAYKHSYDIDTVVLRFGNVYGPGSVHKDSVIAKFIRLALNGECLEIFGDGTQTRDFIYIDDLVNALILSAKTPKIGGEIFQIATSQETTIKEIVQKMVIILKRKGIDRISIINSEMRVGDVKRNYSDTKKAETWLGWKHKVDLDTGLERTIDYFLKGIEYQ